MRLAIDPASVAGQAATLPFISPFIAPPAIVTNKKTKDSTETAPDLEKSLAELEQIVEKLEAGELTLDESLKQFERGVQLTRQCQTALRTAEQKVEILLKKSGADNFEVEPFDTPDSDD
jgi:exodeoxyribonuclease VII small subunit